MSATPVSATPTSATAAPDVPEPAAPAPAAAPLTPVPQTGGPPDRGPGASAPIAPEPAPAPVFQAAAAALIPRITPRMRVATWLRLAYTDLASAEHRILLEWIISLVIVSVVATVLEHDPRLEDQHRQIFVALELLVLVFFVADYALNMYFAPKRGKYIFSVWGLVDLAAILPGLLLIGNFSSLKIIRGVRFLRFLRVIKVAREAQRRTQATEDEDRRSLFIDLQVGVIGFAAVILFVPNDSLRDLMLGFALVATASIGLRRWLVQHQHPTLSVLTLIGSIIWAVMYALSMDGADTFARACGLLLATVAVALISWLQIESPAGGL